MADFHDAWDSEPKSEAERLNALMRAVGEGWGYVPLSVRKEAAELADAFVTAWNTGKPITITVTIPAASSTEEGYDKLGGPFSFPKEDDRG